MPADTASGEVDFDTDIIPILTRYGCNAGACHGAAVGRGGFQLSLFGSRPADDYIALVRELGGRRVNLSEPSESLLLRKATETVEHGGGERFSDDTAAYGILRQWIRQGAARRNLRALKRFDVQPEAAMLGSVNDELTFSARAEFDDGTAVDVTDVTLFVADDPDAVTIDRATHSLRVMRPGEHLVVARYLDQVRPFRVGVAFGRPRPSAQEESEATRSWVDRAIDAKLDRLGIPASPTSNDAAFARRLWLDLTGRLPRSDELQSFLSDTSPRKRQDLIDRLLDSDEFPVFWAAKWAGVLAIDSKRLQPRGAERYQRWIAERFRQDAPWNETANDMLTGNGNGYEMGAVNFIRSADGARELAEAATRVFMGVRLRCANCHDHPLDRWTQDDYHGLAAAFAKINRGVVVADQARGEVTHPITGEPAVPRIPGDRFLDADDNPRHEFARWVTDETNPYFAKAAVNRVWAQLMGRGLIDPVDDIRSTNPATHPELLERLASEFIASGFRFKAVIRIICSSDAYGRSSTTLKGNEYDQRYYSHALTRPLQAEVIADAIADVTGVPIRFREPLDEAGPRGGNRENAPEAPTRVVMSALQLTNNRTPSVALDLLGRCDRSEPCETPAPAAGSLATVLHLLNGDLLNQRLASPEGNLAKWLAECDRDSEMFQRIYRTAFSRPPTVSETAFWNDQLRKALAGQSEWQDRGERQDFFADVMWAVLSSETFSTNH